MMTIRDIICEFEGQSLLDDGREQAPCAFPCNLNARAIRDDDVASLTRSERIVAGVHFGGDLLGKHLGRKSAGQKSYERRIFHNGEMHR